MAARKKAKTKRKVAKRKKAAKSHRSVAALEKALVACKKSKRKKAKKTKCSCPDNEAPTVRYKTLSHVPGPHRGAMNSNNAKHSFSGKKTLVSAGNIDWN